MTGYDTLFFKNKLRVHFSKDIKKDSQIYPFYAHTCTRRLDISKTFFDQIPKKDLFGKMKSSLLFTIEGDEGFNEH
jgi:hypothetical protein